jgi:hypothetical protein
VATAVIRDTDPLAPYPLLNTVPERPKREPVYPYELELDKSETQHEEMLEKNRQLREKYQLGVEN